MSMDMNAYYAARKTAREFIEGFEGPATRYVLISRALEEGGGEATAEALYDSLVAFGFMEPDEGSETGYNTAD